MRIVQANSRQTELVPDESRDRPHAQDDGKQMLADASHAFRSGQFLILPFRATMLSGRNQPAATRDCPLLKMPDFAVRMHARLRRCNSRFGLLCQFQSELSALFQLQGSSFGNR